MSTALDLSTLESHLWESANILHDPVIVERIVNDIDEIVRIVRFDGWQQNIAGAREVKQALRRGHKYKLHTEQDLFSRAYAYVEQYY